MRDYLIRRVGASLVVIVLASMVVFAGVRALPGGPAEALASETGLSAQAIAALNHEYGLDRPLPIQYLRFVQLALEGNLGRSVHTDSPVAQEILTRIPITIELALLAVLFAILTGVPTGIVAAVRRGGPLDYAANALGLLGLSVPAFWLGLMLILLVAVRYHLLPASGYVSPLQDPLGNLQRMIMPAFVLGSPLTAVIFRQMRSAMLESLQAE